MAAHRNSAQPRATAPAAPVVWQKLTWHWHQKDLGWGLVLSLTSYGSMGSQPQFPLLQNEDDWLLWRVIEGMCVETRDTGPSMCKRFPPHHIADIPREGSSWPYSAAQGLTPGQHPRNLWGQGEFWNCCWTGSLAFCPSPTALPDPEDPVIGLEQINHHLVAFNASLSFTSSEVYIKCCGNICPPLTPAPFLFFHNLLVETLACDPTVRTSFLWTPTEFFTYQV